MSTPASIRFWNPGAQYPGPIASRFGSTGAATIGGGHKIAVFDDPVKGAAAQFGLLGSEGYIGRPIGAAISKWSGGNSVDAYLGQLKAAGIDPNAPLTQELLSSPQGITLARAMAQHEAGQPYPLSDEQWRAAQSMAFGESGPTDPGYVPPDYDPAAPSVANGNAAPATDGKLDDMIASLFGNDGGQAPAQKSGAEQALEALGDLPPAQFAQITGKPKPVDVSHLREAILRRAQMRRLG